MSFNTSGGLVATPEVEALVGFTGHPWAGNQAYLYAGFESVDSTGAPNGAGFGAANVNNTGCQIELPTSGTCGALTHRLEQLTGGFWQDIYKGSFGRGDRRRPGLLHQALHFRGLGRGRRTRTSRRHDLVPLLPVLIG